MEHEQRDGRPATGRAGAHLCERLSQRTHRHRRHLHAVWTRRVSGHRSSHGEDIPGSRFPEPGRHLQPVPQRGDARRERATNLPRRTGQLPERPELWQPHPHCGQSARLTRHSVHGALHGHGPQSLRRLGARSQQQQPGPTPGLRQRGHRGQRLDEMEHANSGQLAAVHGQRFPMGQGWRSRPCQCRLVRF